MKWSFSSLKQYINCPKQYEQTRVVKNYVVKDTRHTIFGKEVHKAIEDYIKHETPIPTAYKHMLSQIPEMLALLPEIRYVEHRMAVDINLLPCDFESENYWVRGIADLLAIEDDKGATIDWKSGSSNYADTRQLDLMALLTFAHFPRVNRMKSMLYFVRNKRPVFGKEWHREDMGKIVDLFTPDLTLLQASFNGNSWPVKPSGLCGYCPVETCLHWRH